jgi:hypothetical protein
MRDLAELSRLEERAKRLQAAESEVLTLGIRSGSTQHVGGGGGQDPAAFALHQRTRSAGGEGGASPTFPGSGLQEEDGRGQSRHVYTARSINLDPAHPANRLVDAERQSGIAGPGRIDPFSDAASERSAGDDRSFLTMGTNVIPIAYVPSGGDVLAPGAISGSPLRPLRDPNVDLGLSRRGPPPSSFGLARPPALPGSSTGGADSSSRMSVMSGAPSFMSSNSFALDAPMIAKVNIASAQRANIVPIGALNQPRPPPPPPPSSFPAGGQRPTPHPRRPSNAKSTTGKSPLSNLAIASSPSPGVDAADPFNDANRTLSPPASPHRPSSRANTFGQDDGSEHMTSPVPSFDNGSNLSDHSFARPTRPYSSMSEQSQASAVLQQATLVRVGIQQQAPQFLRAVPAAPSVARSVPRSDSAHTLGQPNVPFAGSEAGDRSSGYTSASTSSLLRDYTFTHSTSTSPVTAAFPSSESTSTASLAYLSTLPLPAPQAANAIPSPGGASNRETQYSLDSTFDFMPPGSTGHPDAAWGARTGRAPSEAVRNGDQEFIIGA